MTNQEGFSFDKEIPHKKFIDDPTPPHKLHRKDGPDTSKEAAYSLHNVAGMEQEVLEVIKQYGESGCISEQVVEHFGPERYATITARYKALLEKGLIVDTGERRTGQSGRKQRVMVAAEYWKGEA